MGPDMVFEKYALGPEATSFHIDGGSAMHAAAVLARSASASASASARARVPPGGRHPRMTREGVEIQFLELKRLGGVV